MKGFQQIDDEPVMRKNRIIPELKQANLTVLLRIYRRYKKRFIKCATGKYPVDHATTSEIYLDTILNLYENVLDAKPGETLNIRKNIFDCGDFQMRLFLKQQNFEMESLSGKENKSLEGFSQEHEMKRDIRDIQIRKILDKLDPDCFQELAARFYHKTGKIRDQEHLNNNPAFSCFSHLIDQIKNSTDTR